MSTWSSGWRDQYWTVTVAALTTSVIRVKSIAASSKGIAAAIFFFVLLVLGIFVFASGRNYIDGNTFNLITSRSWSQSPAQISGLTRPPRAPGKPITLTCPTTGQSEASTCAHRPSVALSPSPSSSPDPAPSLSVTSPEISSAPLTCPDYFRWIHEDLLPWKANGITKEDVESARKRANFRLVVLGGRAYVETYSKAFETRDTFTLWGILQLLSRYPGRVPDLDLMFNCGDTPAVKVADYHNSSPPPLFRYCKDDETLDILFPDWSFWGWAEVNIKPWEKLVEEMKEENRRVKWKDRRSYAFWKGNPYTSNQRIDLMKCNVSNGKHSGALLYSQNWGKERIEGFPSSNLSKQCIDRYKIYIEGRSWSVSDKYILGCDSPTLFVTTQFHDFFSRSLMPGYHYWPINKNHKCRSIDFAINWGNKHQKRAQAIGSAGSKFVHEGLRMENVYDYMLHLLIQYSKLLRYKPAIPADAKEMCLESMGCAAGGTIREFMLESMERWTSEDPPCAMPPPYTPREIRQLSAHKAQMVNKVERMESN